jgi:hypothetical protein
VGCSSQSLAHPMTHCKIKPHLSPDPKVTILSSFDWFAPAHSGLPNPLHCRWIWHASRSESKIVSRL